MAGSMSQQSDRDVQRMLADLYLLVPPYQDVKSVRAVVGTNKYRPELGSILYANGDNVLRSLASLGLANTWWPWAVPCVVVQRSDGETESLIRLVAPEPTRLAIDRVDKPTARATPSAILRSVKGRRNPTSDVVTAFLKRRLGVNRLQAFASEQCHLALAEPPSPSPRSIASYSRTFADHGPFTACGWRAVARLAVHLAAKTPQTWMSMQTLQRHSRKYLAMSVVEARRLFAWEWVLEQALRVGGYVTKEEQQRAVRLWKCRRRDCACVCHTESSSENRCQNLAES